MVTINFTIVVQLILFLGFLWAVNKLVFRPVIKALDEREERIDDNVVATRDDTAQADELEGKYAAEIAAIRRAAHVRFIQERRAAMDERHAIMAKAHEESDKAVFSVEKEGEAQIEAQRAQFGSLSHELGKELTKCLGLGGKFQ